MNTFDRAQYNHDHQESPDYWLDIVEPDGGSDESGGDEPEVPAWMETIFELGD